VQKLITFIAAIHNSVQHTPIGSMGEGISLNLRFQQNGVSRLAPEL
jgi:hypothetical protein